MHRHIRRAVTFIIIIMLSLSVKAWAATATGWVSIDNPADGYGASQNFFVNMSYTVTQDDNFCPNGIFQNWATFLVKLDGSIIYSIVFDSCCGVSPFGSVVPYRAYINISGLDPSKLHTVTAYLEDQVYVSGSGCRTGAIFAQDTITFRIIEMRTVCLPPATATATTTMPISRGAPEICDGKDNDCDGIADEGAGPCCNNPAATILIRAISAALRRALPEAEAEAEAEAEEEEEEEEVVRRQWS